MLKHLHLKHFTIITELSLEFSAGFTVLTGETGAGKSILIDALDVGLGGRADAAMIQAGYDRCEITAIFDVQEIAAAQAWLVEQALDAEENDEAENQCILRRVLSRDGRSRSTINARPCSLQQIREIAAFLLHIHGQNTHSLLMKTNYQRQLLDAFAQHKPLCDAVRQAYERWRKAKEDLQNSQYAGDDREAKKDFLQFQLQELIQLGLQASEWEQLSQEQQRLAHAEQWMSSCQHILGVLTEDEHHCVLENLHNVHQHIKELSNRGAPMGSAQALIHQAVIEVEEASKDVQHYLSTLELDPERLQWVEQRLADIHALARKHKVTPENLLAHQQALQEQLEKLSQSDEYIAVLIQQISEYATQYGIAASHLTQSREDAALRLNQKITAQVQNLGIAHGAFQVLLSPLNTGEIHMHGNEQVEFLVATNPGQPLQPLQRIVSGGELSRIALAIQVVTVQQHTLPTVIFDEVDVGIGGRVAQIVGETLRNLSDSAQVLCVTHQPQVAAQGHVHLRVQKSVNDGKTHTEIFALSEEEKIAEIARMLAGAKVTEVTLAHAKEMLQC